MRRQNQLYHKHAMHAVLFLSGLGDGVMIEIQGIGMIRFIGIAAMTFPFTKDFKWITMQV